MKVLMLFVDMLRPNRFGTINNDIHNNEIDELLESLGGTFYTNCFSPAPDTPRGMACFYTGLLPMHNGCDTRVKWPSKFIPKETSNIFDPFIENKYEMNFFSNPNERTGGLFPPGIENIGTHNQDYDMNGYLNSIDLSDDHLVFISIADYHWALQDWKYTRKGESVAINETRKSLDIVFNNFDKDDFDHIFIFSDHGFKFNAQFKAEQSYEFLNRDRANIFMFIRQKGDVGVNHQNKLCSIQDVSHTIYDLFGLDNHYSLLNRAERDYVVIEDHQSIGTAEVNQNVDIWAIVTSDEMYIRTLKYSITINSGQATSQVINQYYDNLLKSESQFGRYLDEQEKVFDYVRLILAQTNFMNGNKRPGTGKIQKLLSHIEVIKDNIRLFFRKPL